MLWQLYENENFYCMSHKKLGDCSGFPEIGTLYTLLLTIDITKPNLVSTLLVISHLFYLKSFEEKHQLNL